MASATVAIAVCNGVAMAGCGWVRFSSDSKFPARACGMAGCGWAMVAAACGCGAGICAVVTSASFAVGINGRAAVVSVGFAIPLKGTATAVSFGATVEIWLASGSRFSSGSRFLAVACSMAGCCLAIVAVTSGLATVAAACGCGAGICAAVASAGFAVGVNGRDTVVSAGFSVALKDAVTAVSLGVTVKAWLASDSRFLTEACGMAGCGLAIEILASGGGVVICGAVVSAGIAVAVNDAGLSIGFAVAIKLWPASGSRFSRDSRFLAKTCGEEACG